MARIPKNSPFHGTSGRVGDLVFRTRNGKTFVCARPERSTKSTTCHQQQIQSKFMLCVGYGKKAIQDPATRKMYDKGRNEGQSAYNVAFADAAHAPKVHYIDISQYQGKRNDQIVVNATDDFKVDQVIVSIHTPCGKLIEKGNAILLNDDEFRWLYTATKSKKQIAGCIVSAVAIDLPGNEGVETVTV